MRFVQSDFPPLDCHAHIDPTVTRNQVRLLGGAHVFAMTRTLADAAVALENPQSGIHWAVGVHPALDESITGWKLETFEELQRRSFIVGEVGLDRRGRSRSRETILQEILEASSGRVVSVHSLGRVDQVLDAVRTSGAKGAILHWFLGTPAQVDLAVRLGCYFSVNAAMSDEAMRSLPYERVLPETDFPASRFKTKASVPGDTRELESRVASLTHSPLEMVRRHWYRVLAQLVDDAEVGDALPRSLRELVTFATA